MRTVILVLLVACSTPFGTVEQHVDQAWTRHTIQAGSAPGGSYRGADGVAAFMINGALAVAAPWEQSSKVTVSVAGVDPTQPWTTTIVGSNSAAEGVAVADLDADGYTDVVSAGQGCFVKIHFGGATWTTVTIAAASGLQQWMQLAIADFDADGRLDIAAGGRLGAAPSISWFKAPANARDGAAWIRSVVAAADWTMSLVAVDVDSDGDTDLVASNRTSPKGTTWYENGAAWAPRTVSTLPCDPQMLSLAHVGGAPLAVVDGNKTTLTMRRPGWGGTWIAQPIALPSNVGDYHASAIADVDGDNEPDLVLAFAAVPSGSSGVVWLRGPAFTERNEIGGTEGSKFDDLALVDVDGDGDLDVVTSEQADQLGVVWYENPR